MCLVLAHWAVQRSRFKFKCFHSLEHSWLLIPPPDFCCRKCIFAQQNIGQQFSNSGRKTSVILWFYLQSQVLRVGSVLDMGFYRSFFWNNISSPTNVSIWVSKSRGGHRNLFSLGVGGSYTKKWLRIANETWGGRLNYCFLGFGFGGIALLWGYCRAWGVAFCHRCLMLSAAHPTTEEEAAVSAHDAGGQPPQSGLFCKEFREKMEMKKNRDNKKAYKRLKLANLWIQKT